MRRLLASIRCDVRLQLRNGFYHAAGFVVAVWALLLYGARGLAWGAVLPALVMGNLVMSTFYFMGGLVLLERGERSLEARVTTPLRTGEYLASKVLTLTALAVVENLLLSLVLAGTGVRILPLVAGSALAAALFSLAGFVAVVRYRSINEYLLPSVAYSSALLLPLFAYFGVGASPLMYLHPLQAPLVLLQAAFRPVSAGEMGYGVLYAAAWIALFFHAARGAFRRFVVAAAA